MSVDKKVSYEIQGGVKNYKPSEMVTVPKKAKSSPKHPATELAYITKAEKDLLIKKNLHGSLKGKVNKGPGGVMSLNGDYSDMMGGVTGADISAAERGEGPRGGMSDQDASDFRSAAINAGAGQRVNPGFFDSRTTISPEEEAAAKAYREQDTIQGTVAEKAYNATRGGTFGNFISGGGILGAGVRGLGQMFGLGKTYNQPTYDMSKYNQLGYYPDRVKGYTTPEGYEFLDNEKQAAIDLELFNKGMYTDDYKDMYGLGMDDDGDITTINTNDGDNNTQNLVETINGDADGDGDVDETDKFIFRYFDKSGKTLQAGAGGVEDLMRRIRQRLDNIFTT
tara:strand:+ start:42 stop:1052 length:1011 start_codon:yes stop_codon:yes gene_type:complete